MKRFLQNISLVLFVGNMFFLSLLQADAKGVTWNKTEENQLAYYWNCSGSCPNGASGWERGLSAPNIGVSYNANVYNFSTGQLIADGSSLSVGTCISVVPSAHNAADLTWFGSGFSMDSPNGHWISGAAAPDFACLSGDRSASGFTDSYGNQYDTYSPFSVNPPATNVTFSGTATVTPQGGNNYCITTPGSVQANVNFSQTYGKFYYRYILTYRNYSGMPINQCLGNQTAMKQITAVIPPPLCISIGGSSCTDSLTYETADYQTDIPQQQIDFNFTVAGTNNPPNPPTITGPTTGNVSTSYPYNIQASDPDGDTVRYGIDWDNNGSVDQWTPGSGYVASNTTQSATYSWGAAGAYTFRALTQDSNGAQSGWVNHTITLAAAPTAPVVDLTINGSNGPLTVGLGTPLSINWTTSNATSCTAYGAGWGSGTAVATSGSASISASTSDNYILQCTGPGGTTSDTVQVILSNVLKVCQNSCNSGILRGNTSSTQNFTMASSATQNLVACFNPAASCTDASGNVSASATWAEGGGSAITLSGSDPRTVTAGVSGTESLSASYSGQTANMSVTVACIPTVTCSNASGRENYCQNQTFTVDNGCSAIITCNGTKSCNYNWKEVAP
jgi:hypothetical protein